MNLCNKKKCTGCSACKAICPVHAISMKKDERGFLNPDINENLCVSCGLCEKVVIELNNHLNIGEHKDKPKKAYAIINNNYEKRISSQSGGLFYALAETILDLKGIVYGCAYLDNHHVAHCRIDNKKDLNSLRGSKYVQSDMNNCLESLIDDLKNDRIVLFSGTPCQVAGVESLLRTKKVNTEKFYSCDFICHGVPSPKLYEDYLEFIQNKYSSKIKKVNLRDKSKGGWNNHMESIELENGEIFLGKYYVDLFYSNLGLRSACESCEYTNLNRPSDITMADCWGIEKKYPQLWNDNKGISLGIIQTDKGSKLFELSKKYLEYFELKEEEYIQPQLVYSSKTPIYKEKFWNDYKKLPFENILKKYTIYGGIPFKIKRKALKAIKWW